jgi:hypothetical protein
MPLQDLIDIVPIHIGIPGRLWIDDQNRPQVTTIHAACSGNPYSTRAAQSLLFDLGFQIVSHGLGSMTATAWTPVLPLIDTEKEVITIVRHEMTSRFA